MNGCIKVLSIAPGASVQDLGRPGYQRYGVSESGVMDRMAMAHGAALLRQSAEHPVVELCGGAAQFQLIGQDTQLAVTGAPARVTVDDNPVQFCSSFSVADKQKVTITPQPGSVYTYLHVAGGFVVPLVLGSASTHLRAAFGGFEGRYLQALDCIPITQASAVSDSLQLAVEPLQCSEIRVVWGAQAERFSPQVRSRFLATEFGVSNARDRMGIRLHSNDNNSFAASGGLSGISDAVIAGDVQIGGDGMATVLLADRQPTGGYPRIATVITADLNHMAQLPAGARFRFSVVSIAQAVEALADYHHTMTSLPGLVQPLYRDPQHMQDLLSYNLVGGVIDAKGN